MFSHFDFEVLDDLYFKEDSVREELIVPIIKALGYSVTGDARIVRSKPLVHPYVAIGSQRKNISIIPDYLFMLGNKPYWILDAKSPTEDILKSKHIEQAYSYAIHPEVRAELYALCNGREFILYSIGCFEPVLHFALKDIEKYWEKLFRILNPETKANPELVNYNVDYGLHVRRLGCAQDLSLSGYAVHSNNIAKIEDGLYTTSTVITLDKEYLLSLDFNEKQLNQLLSLIPKHLAELLSNGLKRQPYHINLKNDEFKFGVEATLKSEVIHNAEESYIPFEVVEFTEYRNFEER